MTNCMERVKIKRPKFEGTWYILGNGPWVQDCKVLSPKVVYSCLDFARQVPNRFSVATVNIKLYEESKD